MKAEKLGRHAVKAERVDRADLAAKAAMHPAAVVKVDPAEDAAKVDPAGAAPEDRAVRVAVSVNISAKRKSASSV